MRKIFGRVHWRKKRVLVGALIVLGVSLTLWLLSFKVPFYKVLQPPSLFIRQLYRIIEEFEFNISKNVEDVKIILWTDTDRQHEYIFRDWNETQLSLSGYNASLPTKILIHGFSDDPRTMWTKNFRVRYLDVAPANIFSVDWSLLALSPWYTTAAKNANTVGEHVAGFIEFLIQHGDAYENIHVLGASLGAHVAGYVGFYSQGRIGRITGLDPSGPLFHSTHHKHRLDKRDAVFVDIIHSAGKWVGNDDIMGHADFFLNGGQAPQPLCINKESIDLTCSHFVSWKMFGESISSPKDSFWAVPCENSVDFYSGVCCKTAINASVIFGEFVDKSNSRGTYYLKTNDRHPFSLPFNQSIGCL